MVLGSKELASKYFKELNRLYEELFRFKIREILVQFNEEEYKTVPILSSPESIRYLLSQESSDLRVICEEGVQMEQVMRGMEQLIVGQIKYL